MSKISLSAVVRFAVLFGFALSTSHAVAQDEKVDFAKSIKPIFEKHCISCHGPTEEESFRIDIKDDAMDFIEPGDADESYLYEVLISDDEEELMPPPDEENPMTKAQIQLVKTWINEGADWPEDVKLVEPGESTAADEADPKDAATTKPAAAAEPVAEPSSSNDDDGEDQTESAEPAEPDDTKQETVSRKTKQIQNAMGSLHPAAVHLPIGLLLASGLFAVFSLRGNFVMSDCAYYCLWLGAIGAVLASVSGWYFSPMENRGTVSDWADLTDMDQKIFWHRTSALIITAFALVLALFAASARNRDPDDGIMWKLGLILLAAGVGWVGHEGGELTHGKKLYKDLEMLAAETFPSVFGNLVDPEELEKIKAMDKQPETPPDSPEDDDDDADDDGEADDEIGKSSDET